MSVRITGANELYKKIDKIATWSERDSVALQNVGHRVGAVYANYIQANVKDLDKDITVRGLKVKKGQLRRSGGTWLPNKNRNTVMSGPRTNAIGRRKTKKAADGWYAHIVEKGDFGPRFGGKHRTQNTGVFSRGMKATTSRSLKLQEMLLKQNFAKYIRVL
tara:strand:+ start:239 stop:721 length:483 start_codon:yes stop_codon:yes gene_type:complete